MDKVQMMLALMCVVLAVFVSTSEGLQCYNCRSDHNKTCADEFDVDDPENKQYLVDCAPEETYCRKIGQDVYGDYVTIRQCGETEVEMHCRDRVGSKGIKLNYCNCDTDKCNGSNQVKSTGVLLQALATLLMAFLLRNAL